MQHNPVNLLKMESCYQFALWTFVFCLMFQSNHGFHLVDSHHSHTFTIQDELLVRVKSLTSINTHIPFNYYTLPFCKPKDGVKDSAVNLGVFLMGDRIQNSPYRVSMFTNMSEIFVCSVESLSIDQVNILKKRIDENYQVNLLLDNLPAIRYKNNVLGDSLGWPGYPIGFKVQDIYYLVNHLKFHVFVHKHIEPVYEVIGFKVEPCSYNHDADSIKNLNMYDKYPSPIKCDHSFSMAMPIKEGLPIVFTYEVTFKEIDIKSPYKWYSYFNMEDAKLHRFSIFSALVLIIFLAGVILEIGRRDLICYNEAQEQRNEELSGWKLIMGDVFHAPSNPALLCVMVGDGVRIAMTLLFSVLQFTMLPSSPGTFITSILFFYMILGGVAGYVAVWLWKMTNCGDHKGWVSIALKTACFFPGLAFSIFTVIDFLLWRSYSTEAIPFSLYIMLLLLWLCISIPLTLVGGYLEAKKHSIAQYPIETSKILRETPQKWYQLSWLLVLGGGILPFGTLYIELFIILSSIWIGKIYFSFGYLFISLILLVLVCAETSLLLTYLSLRAEDWKWWWKSFFASGSVALYIFWYSISYLIFDHRNLSGTMPTTIYLGFSVLMVIAVMLGTGAVGFLSSFWFVYYLFCSVKANGELDTFTDYSTEDKLCNEDLEVFPVV